MSVDEKTEDMLRGQKFINKTITKIIDGKECVIERICEKCFNGTIEDDVTKEIKYAGKCSKFEANILFGEQPLPLPAKLDGKDVGNYCPCFTFYDAFKYI